jgi:hypothetical protein
MEANKRHLKLIFFEVIDYRVEAFNLILAKIRHTAINFCKVMDMLYQIGWF